MITPKGGKTKKKKKNMLETAVRKQQGFKQMGKSVSLRQNPALPAAEWKPPSVRGQESSRAGHRSSSRALGVQEAGQKKEVSEMQKGLSKNWEAKAGVRDRTGDYPLTCHTLQGSPEAKAKGDAKSRGSAPGCRERSEHNARRAAGDKEKRARGQLWAG